MQSDAAPRRPPPDAIRPAPHVTLSAEAPAVQVLLDERSLSRLRWRCRRGLLENDLFVERYFQVAGDRITVTQAQGLQALMDLADNDLLDLLLARKPLEGELDRPEVRDALHALRSARTRPTN